MINELATEPHRNTQKGKRPTATTENRSGYGRSFLQIVLLAFVSFTFSSPSYGLNLKKIMMPGPLSSVHAKLEKDCANCHDPLDKTRHRTSCLACHKDVASDVAGTTGFHGKNTEVKKSECLHCHTEHQGRDFNIILMDLDNFDHTYTDFSLKKSHQTLSCSKCHRDKIKYRDTPKKCYGCHAAIAPHHGELGTECSSCHQETSWQNFRFDHQLTKYPLEGPHKTTQCLACHANQRWRGLAHRCVDCHKINDIHAGNFGEKCDQCHNPFAQPTATKKHNSLSTTNDWHKVKFNHATTTFKLTEKHKKVSCSKCHGIKQLREGNKSKQPIFTCFTCHQEDDEHKSRFGKECEQCHTAKGWKKVIFDHNKTKFPLIDSHSKVNCRQCHTGRVKEQKLSPYCVSCHRLDDKHQGALGQQCELCHTSLAWKPSSFNHSNTTFPLTNKHFDILCRDCHSPEAGTNKIDTSCIACHLKNDAHKGQEGKRCDKCHNTKGWHTEIFFDHDLTSFPLLGLHILPPCEACHLSNTYKDTESSCKSCHDKNDIHEGFMGENCFNCHNPNGWKIWSFDHNKKTSFKLTGKHIDLSCTSCHTHPITKKNKLPNKCSACHQQHDAHRGKFGKFCGRCHITESFKKLKM